MYIINAVKAMNAGTMDNYPDPDAPLDLGDPLTQDEIDFVKKLKKEMERFTAP